MINISEEVLADLLEQSPEQVTSAIKNGEDFKSQEEIETWLRDALDNKVNESRRSVRDSILKRGKKQALTAKERELAEKHGLSGTIDEIVEALLEGNKAIPDMTPEAVRNTEIFKTEQKKWMDETRTAKESAAEIQTTYQRKEVGFKSRQLGARLLKENNFVTPDGVTDETMWKNFLYQNLEDADTRIATDSNGDLVVLDANGELKMDPQTVAPVTFDSHFLATAGKMFKVAKSDDRKSPGNKTPAPGGGGPAGNPSATPNTQEEFMAGMMAQQGSEAKKEYIAKFGSKFGVQ